jgi:hypothetical protein
MIEAALLAIALIATASLIAAVLTLRSSLRSEELGESRRELLRDQQERLELLREERQTLVEALEQESQERRQLLGYLKNGGTQWVDGVEGERERQLVAQQQAERQEQERARLQLELQRLQERLEQERREHAEHQQAAEQVERERQDRARLEDELRRSQAELDRLQRATVREQEDKPGASRPWSRRPLPVAGLLLGGLIAWFVSLAVALSMLAS